MVTAAFNHEHLEGLKSVYYNSSIMVLSHISASNKWWIQKIHTRVLGAMSQELKRKVHWFVT